MMEMTFNDEKHTEVRLEHEGGEDSFVIFSGLEDYNFEFSYEDFEHVTGKTYLNFLHLNDEIAAV